MSMTLSTSVTDLLNDLLIAAAPGHGPPLFPGRRPALEAELTRTLADPERLHDHIRFLGKQLVGHFPSLDLLDESLTEAVLQGGLAVLDDVTLARLALDPVALAGLADEIEERQPPGWAETLREDGEGLLRRHGRSVPSLEEVLDQHRKDALRRTRRPAEVLVGALNQDEETVTSWRFARLAAECEWLGGTAAAGDAAALVEAEWRGDEGLLLVSVGGLLRQGPGSRVEVSWRTAEGGLVGSGELVDQIGLVKLASPMKQAPRSGQCLEVRNVWRPTPGTGCEVRVVLAF
jgi:hypothetical protein